MTSKETFMKNYTSLMEKTNNSNLAEVLQFCNYFQSDDIELFKEYKERLDKGLKIIDFVELFGKRYGLDPAKDLKQIAYLFLKNTLSEGVCFHLGSSANYNSIMTRGLGIKGMRVEDDLDYVKLKETLSSDLFRKLQPFAATKVEGKTFYSNVPILEARYGSMPEWIIELKKNYSSVEEELKKDPNAYKLVSQLLNKYDKKYSGYSKQLFLFPNPLNMSEEKINSLLKLMPSADVMAYIYCNVLAQKDLSTSDYIPPRSILAVDLDSYKISYSNKEGEIVEYGDSTSNKVSNI